MIRFTIRTLLKNKTLWAWPGIFLLFVGAIFIWGDIAADPSSASYFIQFADINLPASNIINQLISVVILISIIGIPTHFSENLKSDRASLILSKPISRTELFFSDIAGMLIFSFFYTAICVVLIGLLTAIQGAIFPFQHLLGLLIFLPLTLLTFYITIILFLILTNSYLGGVILGYFLTGFSSFFLNLDRLMQMLGSTDTWFETLLQILAYLIPSAEAFQQIMRQVFDSGFSGIDISLLGFAFVSCLPFTLLGYYLYQKRQF